jgi:hypothetical protein
MLTQDQLSALASAANAAPSADNQHVFRLARDGDSICLQADERLFAPPAHRRLLGLISVGAAVENLVLRGARLGLHLEPSLHRVTGVGAVLARLQVSPKAVPPPNPIEAAIEHRQSNRLLFYRGPGLPPEQRQTLDAYCAAVPGASLVWLDEPNRRRAALMLLRRAEAERFRNRTLHRELFDAIRFDVGWHASADRGLPPGALGLPLPERLGFGLLRHWWVQRLGNVFGLHQLVGLRAAYLPCRWAPHLLAVTTAGSSEHDAFRAGQTLQRAWLSVTARGMAGQVYAAAGLYGRDEATDVRMRLRLELRRGWQHLCPGRTVWLVLRLGHAPAPPVRACRPAADLLWNRH